METQENNIKKGAEVFDELFGISNRKQSSGTPPNKEEQEENRRFREAMWNHAGQEGDMATNFDKFYNEHKDKVPAMHQRLGRDGLRTRYNEAYSKQKDFKGEDLEKAKKGFLDHSF